MNEITNEEIFCQHLNQLIDSTLDNDLEKLNDTNITQEIIDELYNKYIYFIKLYCVVNSKFTDSNKKNENNVVNTLENDRNFLEFIINSIKLSKKGSDCCKNFMKEINIGGNK